MKVTCSDWSETKQQRELQAILQLCHDSEHLVRVYEIIREKDCKLYFVCEFMPDGDLKDLLANYQRQGKLVEPEVICSMLHQILLGLRHIHSKGFMHRDLKPENLLLSGGKCKVADFSLARPVTSAKAAMTTYVSSRWYRAPELVLEATVYTTAIDIFALGCVMAEMLSLYPLFPGRDEQDQLPVMLSLLGPLIQEEWPEGVRLLQKLRVNLPSDKAQPTDTRMTIPQRLSQKLCITDTTTISLLDGMLTMNPRSRLCVNSALQHSYFSRPHSMTSANSPLPLGGGIDFHCDGGTSYMQTPMSKDRTLSTSSVRRNRIPMVSISPSTRAATALVGIFDGNSPQVGMGYTGQRVIAGDANRYQSSFVPFTADDVSLFSHTNTSRSGYRPSHAFGID